MTDTFKMNDKILTESYNAFWLYKYTNAFLTMSIVFAVMLIMIIADTKKIEFYSFGLILPILFGITMFFRKKRSVKSIARSFTHKYKGRTPLVHIRFEDNIVQDIEGELTSIPYKDVTKIIDSRNLIILVLKEKMFCILSKNGFKDGNYKKCIELIKEKANIKIKVDVRTFSLINISGSQRNTFITLL